VRIAPISPMQAARFWRRHISRLQAQRRLGPGTGVALPECFVEPAGLRGSQLPHVLTRVGVQLPGQVRTAAQRDAPVCRVAVNQQTAMP
jgi:hypothetical protein